MKTLSSLLVFCFLGTLTARAWDNPGHMAVAGLAYDELSSSQQKKLANLIRKHPGFNLIAECFPDPDIDDRDLVMGAATWPDLAKRATSEGYKDIGYEEHDPAVTKVEFDHKMHKGYHFIDTPLWVGNGSSQALPEIPNVNAVGVVNVLVAQLKSGEADPLKAYDLAWLLHLVGDLHQPLHAVTGVSETHQHGDTGGNAIHLTSAHNGGVTDGADNLHSFCDDILGKTAHSDSHGHARLDVDGTTADEIIDMVHKLKLPASAEKLDPAVWAKESFALATRDGYSFQLQVIPGEHEDKLEATLDTQYLNTASSDAKKRVRLAGHRLALLLKQML